MVGQAVCRRLAREDGVTILVRSRQELDLTNRSAIESYYGEVKPDAVVFCAARVGGIGANDSYPVEFMTENLLMSLAAINAAFQAGVERFLYLGSTCIYPREAEQPLRETALLSGPLEKTNEAYALAKICGLKLCEYHRRQHGVLYHSAMPTNLYGPGDNYHPQNSHVLPALLRRIHDAMLAGERQVTIWGTGAPRREFLHVDDLAEGLVHLLQLNDPPSLVNVGTGKDCTVAELARLIARVVGYEGQITFDPSRPDGTPRKVTDVTLMHQLGWRHRIDLPDGIARTYYDFQQESKSGLREI
jgi:GDP-L-fucose synthase